MPDLKISQLTDGLSIGAADTLVAVRAGSNVKLPANLLGNTTWLQWRNAANNGNINVIRLNGSDIIEIGNTTNRVQIGPAGAPGNSPMLFSQQQYDGKQSGNLNNSYFYTQAKGARDKTHALYNIYSHIQDQGVLPNRTITGASRSGTTITITTGVAHGYSNGDRIMVDNVTHTFDQDINGTWAISNVGSTTFDYTVPSISSGAYTSGGITLNTPGYHGLLVQVEPVVDRGNLHGPNLYGNDVAGIFVVNSGTAKAIDVAYSGRNSGLALEWDTSGSYDAASYMGILVNNVVGVNTPVFRGTARGTGATPEIMMRMARGTFEAPRRTKNADLIGRISGVPHFAADDSTNAGASGATARIDFYANEDQTATGQGSRIVFYTTPLSSTTINERFRVAPADGIDFASGTFSAYCIRLKNNTWITSVDNGSGTVNLMRLDSSNLLKFGGGSSVGILATGASRTVDDVITHLQGLGLARQS